MNPQIHEEIGQTTRDMIKVFRSTPMVAAVLFFNIAFIGIIAWSVHEAADRWHRLVVKVVDTCGPKHP